MSQKCCNDVWNGAYHSAKCGKPAKFEVDGKHYCGIHNPNKPPTKAQIEAEENRVLMQKKWRLENAAPDLLEALQLIAAISTGSTTNNSLPHIAKVASAAISKATGETP